MAGLREQRGLNSSVTPPDSNKDLPNLPHDPSNTYHPNAPSNEDDFTALPQFKGKGKYIPPYGSAIEPDPYYNQRDSYQTADTGDYSNTGSSPGGDDGKRKLRKLMKRKPLPNS